MLKITLKTGINQVYTKLGIFITAIFFFNITVFLPGTLTSKINNQETVSSIIAEQYFGPYKKKKLFLASEIQKANIEKNLAINIVHNKTKLIELYEEYTKLSNWITTRNSIFAMYADNEVIQNEQISNIINYKDYSDNLYVVCGPCENQKNLLGENQKNLLDFISKHTQLLLGKIKVAKTLGQPIVNHDQLLCKQKILKELSKNQNLLNSIDKHLKNIKKLEKTILSFWDTEKVQSILTHGPHLSNGTFAPILSAMKEAEKQFSNNNSETVLEFEKAGNKNSLFLGISNTATLCRDANLMIFGLGMINQSKHSIYSGIGSIYSMLSELSIGSLVLPTSVILTTEFIIQKIINRSIKNRLYAKATKITKTLEQKPISIVPQKTGLHLTFENKDFASTCIRHITTDSQLDAHIQDNIVQVSLTPQEKRTLRLSHFFNQHKRMFHVLAITIACCFYYGNPITELATLPWDTIFSSVTKLPLIALPWTIMKILTTASTIPAIVHHNFLQTPKQAIKDTTVSIENQKKAILSISKLMQEIYALKKLIQNNNILKQNMLSARQLSIEKTADTNLKIALKLQQSNYLTSDKYKKALVELIKLRQDQIHDLRKLLYITQANLPTNKAKAIEPNLFSLIYNKIKTRLFSNDISAAYAIMLNIKELFSPVLETIGELDMYVATVKLLKEFENKNITYCFPTYEQQSTPHLKLINAWNPLLQNITAPENIVGNSIELGIKNTDKSGTAIISGPTEGGKSTFLRTVATNILLALTFGIVPAENFALTPPAKLLLSFNVKDNIGKKVTGSSISVTGTSGFRSEVETLKSFIQTIKKTKESNQFCFVILDELFQKLQQSGELFSYEVIKQSLLPLKNSLNIIVSHREQPKLLEENTNGICKNYRFQLSSLNTELVNTYKLIPGKIIRKNFVPITWQEIHTDTCEDLYNLQILRKAGLINKSIINGEIS